MKMDADVYKLRRKVINVLYDLKRDGFDLPRIEVRIVKDCKDAMAYAYIGKNIIHVDMYWLLKFKDTKLLVMHEIGHAVFGLGRIEGCTLMDCNRDWEWHSDTSEENIEIFRKYYNNYKNK